MKKIVKILIILTLIFGAGVFLSVKARSISTQKKERFFYKKIEENLSGDYMDANLKELTNFEWDYVCTSSAYDPSQEESYGKFYLKNKLVAEIIGRKVKFPNKKNGEIKEIYFSFGDSVRNSGSKPREKEYAKCESFESSYSADVKVIFYKPDSWNYLVLKFFY